MKIVTIKIYSIGDKPKEGNMSTLYTEISQIGKKRIIVLNRNYTKEQLRDKLSVPGGPSKFFLREILTEGIYLNEPLEIKLHADAIITTQQKGCMWYCYKKDKVAVKPDGGFIITSYISPFEKLQYKMEGWVSCWFPKEKKVK